MLDAVLNYLVRSTRLQQDYFCHLLNKLLAYSTFCFYITATGNGWFDWYTAQCAVSSVRAKVMLSYTSIRQPFWPEDNSLHPLKLNISGLFTSCVWLYHSQSILHTRTSVAEPPEVFKMESSIFAHRHLVLDTTVFEIGWCHHKNGPYTSNFIDLWR